MRNIALLGASALVLALGVASASAQPSDQSFLTRGSVGTIQTYSPNSGAISEGRAAAVNAPAADAFIYQPHFGR